MRMNRSRIKPQAPLRSRLRQTKQPDKKNKQRHQVDILPGAKKIKSNPSMAIHDRGNKPTIRGLVQLAGRRSRKIEVSEDGMDGDNDTMTNARRLLSAKLVPDHLLSELIALKPETFVFD